MIIGLLGQAGAGKDTTADFLVKNHNFVKVALADPLKRIARDVFAFTDEQLWGPSEKRNAPDARYLRRKAGANGCSDVRAFIKDGKVDFSNTGYAGLGYEELVTYYGDPENFGFLPSPPRDEYLTPRYALQQLGSEWGRNCYPNVWVDYALRVSKALLTRADGYDAKKGLRDASHAPPGTMAPGGVVISDVRFKNEVDAINAAGGKVWKIVRPGSGLEGAAGKHVSETEQEGIDHEHFACIIKNDMSLSVLEQLTKEALELAQK